MGRKVAEAARRPGRKGQNLDWRFKIRVVARTNQKLRPARGDVQN
jgi:hypothetical protein